ncbi:hypothetical protein HBH53_154150 [Parastagonospora nodorum]|nr:hypothetical protein HBH53_154150 [Parastagonospora nodorum]KAH4014443.1 hypothetical protein HBI09_210560 [Parastagonospora nodorum]KAH4063077.1 hypothetical protein HBH50_199260 [Parastagonospora nodorum]KAH4083512.1 hypothetical protein HBH48_176160 [Parastagonospora nodorum]KAH4805643.1 hypothetical protein HBH61_154740 [Parastagonospora nodorum]
MKHNLSFDFFSYLPYPTQNTHAHATQSANPIAPSQTKSRSIFLIDALVNLVSCPGIKKNETPSDDAKKKRGKNVKCKKSEASNGGQA